MKERSASKAFFRRRQKDPPAADVADCPDAVDVTVHHNDLISSTSTSWFASPKMAPEAKHKRASWSAFPQHLEEQQCGSTHGSSPCTPLDTRKSHQLRSRSFSIENLDNSVGGSSENLKKSKRKGGFGSMRFTPSFLRGSASSIKELFSGIGGKNRGSSDSLHQSVPSQPMPQTRRNSLGNHQQATGIFLGTQGLRDSSLGLPIACNSGTFDGGHIIDGCCVLCGNDSSLHSTIGCRRMRGTNLAPSSRVDTREGNLGSRCGEFSDEVVLRKWSEFADGGGCRNSGVFTVLEEDENETSFERVTDSSDKARRDPRYENVSASKIVNALPSRVEPRDPSRAARVLFAQPKSDVVRCPKGEGHSSCEWPGSSSSKTKPNARFNEPLDRNLPRRNEEARTQIDEPRVVGCNSNLKPGSALDPRFTAPYVSNGGLSNRMISVDNQYINPNAIHHGSSGGFVPNPIYLNGCPVVRDRSNSVAVGYRDGHRLMGSATELCRPAPWPPNSSSRLDPGPGCCRNSRGSYDDIRIGVRAFPPASGMLDASQKAPSFFDKENVVPESKQPKKLSKSNSFKQSFSFMNAKSFFPKLDGKKKLEKGSSKVKLSDSKNSKDSSSVLEEKSLAAPSSSARCVNNTFEECDDTGFSSFVNDIRRRSLRCTAAVDFIRTPSKRSLFTRGPLRSSAKSSSHSHYSNSSAGTDQLSFHSVDHSNSSTKLDTSFSYLAFNRRRFNKLTGSSRSTQSAPAYALSPVKNGIDSQDRWQHESVEERPEDNNRLDDSDLQRDVGNHSSFASEPNNYSSRYYENLARDASGMTANASCFSGVPDTACSETVSPVVDKPTKVTPMKANKRKKRRTKKKQRNSEKTVHSSSQALSKEHPDAASNSKLQEGDVVPCGNSANVPSDCVDGVTDFFKGLQDRATSVHSKLVPKSSVDNSKQSLVLHNAQHPMYPLAQASAVAHSWSTHPVPGHPALGLAHPPLQAASSAPAQYCCGASPSCCPHTWVPNGACCGDGMPTAVVPDCCASNSAVSQAYRLNCSLNPLENVAGSSCSSRVAPSVSFERSLSSPGSFQAMPWTSGAQLGLSSYSSGNIGSSVKYPMPARPMPVPEEPHEGLFLPHGVSGGSLASTGMSQPVTTPPNAATRLRHQNNLIIDVPKDPLSPCLSSASYASPSFFRDNFPEPHLNEEYSAPLDIALSSNVKHEGTLNREAGMMYMQPLNPPAQEITHSSRKMCSEIRGPMTGGDSNKCMDHIDISVREKSSSKPGKSKSNVTAEDIKSVTAHRNKSSSESRFYNCMRNPEPLCESSSSLASMNSASRVPRSAWNYRRESVGVCTQKSSPLSSNCRSLSCQSISQSYSSIEQSCRSVHQSNQSIHRTATQRNFLSGSSCQSLAQSASCRSSSSLTSCLSQASCEQEIHSHPRAVESGNRRRSDSNERFSESSSVLGLADLYSSNKDLSPAFVSSGSCSVNSQGVGTTMISQPSVKSRSSKMKKALMETTRSGCTLSNDSNEPFYENHGSLSVNRFFFDEHNRPGTTANAAQTSTTDQVSSRNYRSNLMDKNGSPTSTMSARCEVGGNKLENTAAQSDSALLSRHESEKVDRSLYSFFPMAHCSTFPGADCQLDDRISEIYFRPEVRNSKPSETQTNSELELPSAACRKIFNLDKVPKSSESIQAHSLGLKNSNEKIVQALPLRESTPPPLPPPLPRSVLDAVARMPASSQHPSSSLPSLPSGPAPPGGGHHSASHPSLPPRNPRLVFPLDSVVGAGDQLKYSSSSSSHKFPPNANIAVRIPLSSTNDIPRSSIQTCHSDGAHPCSPVQFASLPLSLRQSKSPQDHGSGLGKSKSCGDASSTSSCDVHLKAPFSCATGSETTATGSMSNGTASICLASAAEPVVSASSPLLSVSSTVLSTTSLVLSASSPLFTSSPVMPPSSLVLSISSLVLSSSSPVLSTSSSLVSRSSLVLSASSPVLFTPSSFICTPSSAVTSTGISASSERQSSGSHRGSLDDRHTLGESEMSSANEETLGNEDQRHSLSHISRQNSPKEESTLRSAVFTNEEQFQRLKSDLVALKADDHKLLGQLLTLHAHIQQLSGRPFVSPPPSPPTSLRPSTAQTFLRGLPPTPVHNGCNSSDTAHVASSRVESLKKSDPSKSGRALPGNLSSNVEAKSSPSNLSNENYSDPIHASLSELGLPVNACDRDYENVDQFSDILPACVGITSSLSSCRHAETYELSTESSVTTVPQLPSRKVSSASEIFCVEGPRVPLCKRSASFPHCPVNTDDTPIPVTFIGLPNTKEDPENLPPCPDLLRSEVVTALLQSQQLQRGPDGEVQDGSNLVTVL